MSIESDLKESVKRLNLVDCVSSDGQNLTGELLSFSKDKITLRVGDEVKNLYRTQEFPSDISWNLEKNSLEDLE